MLSPGTHKPEVTLAAAPEVLLGDFEVEEPAAIPLSPLQAALPEGAIELIMCTAAIVCASVDGRSRLLCTGLDGPRAVCTDLRELRGARGEGCGGVQDVAGYQCDTVAVQGQGRQCSGSGCGGLRRRCEGRAGLFGGGRGRRRGRRRGVGSRGHGGCYIVYDRARQLGLFALEPHGPARKSGIACAVMAHLSWLAGGTEQAEEEEERERGYCVDSNQEEEMLRTRESEGRVNAVLLPRPCVT